MFLAITWLSLVFVSTVLFAAIYWFSKNRDNSRMLKLGLFLAFFDLGFENLGALADLWVSKNSVLFVGFAPVELFVIALLAGCAYSLLFKPVFDARQAALVAVPIALVGTLIEALMISQGQLEYAIGWTSFLALPTYWFAFILFAFINSRL